MRVRRHGFRSTTIIAVLAATCVMVASHARQQCLIGEATDKTRMVDDIDGLPSQY
jgi:hypothetical protein